MDADQRGRPEAQKADAVRNLAVLARVDQRAVEGDIGAPAAQAGVDDAERFGCCFGQQLPSS
jgi:hypothetical protein